MRKHVLWVGVVKRRFAGINGIEARPGEKAGVREDRARWVRLPPAVMGRKAQGPFRQWTHWHVVRGCRGGVPFSPLGQIHTPTAHAAGSAPGPGTQSVASKGERYYFALVNNSYHARPKDSFWFSLIWLSSFGGKGEAGKSKRTGPAMGNPVTCWALPTTHGTRCWGSDGKTRDYRTRISPVICNQG